MVRYQLWEHGALGSSVGNAYIVESEMRTAYLVGSRVGTAFVVGFVLGTNYAIMLLDLLWELNML